MDLVDRFPLFNPPTLFICLSVSHQAAAHVNLLSYRLHLFNQLQKTLSGGGFITWINIEIILLSATFITLQNMNLTCKTGEGYRHTAMFSFETKIEDVSTNLKV